MKMNCAEVVVLAVIDTESKQTNRFRGRLHIMKNNIGLLP